MVQPLGQGLIITWVQTSSRAQNFYSLANQAGSQQNLKISEKSEKFINLEKSRKCQGIPEKVKSENIDIYENILHFLNTLHNYFYILTYNYKSSKKYLFNQVLHVN